MNLSVQEWLDVVRPEYLQRFIRDGGAAVKFLVPLEGADRMLLKDELRAVAQDEGYAYALVDAAQTKIHMIDHVFHAVAKQIDWNALARNFALGILRENGWSVPAEGDTISLSCIGELNHREPHMIKSELSKLLEHHVWQDYRLSQEFRIAMFRLCQAQLDPALSPVPAEAIERWLRGELKRVTEVKDAPIFQKVGRHNARHMLSSLSYWLHLSGRSGLFLVLDITRCLSLRPRPLNPDDATRYYSVAGVKDAYEMLRQLVDETDDLEHCFVAVLASPEFLDPVNRRSVERYRALKMRIWDEVRDERYVNPLGCLIRLDGACCEEAATEDKV